MSLHFGLGKSTSASELTVRWPSGRVDRFTDVAAGSITVVEGEKEIRR
jgi:hypothetical protein